MAQPRAIFGKNSLAGFGHKTWILMCNPALIRKAEVNLLESFISLCSSLFQVFVDHPV